jgi:translation initiation factor 5B
LAERGFDAERFDRITKFKKQIAIVPCSGTTGEGVAEVLMMLAGLAQQFLTEKLTLSETGRGTVLEVKEVRGLGLTIDVILYDGKARKGDYLVIGGKEPIVTKIKALLRPRPLQEIRVEKQFDSMDEVHAAAGIKISALNLEGVVAGSPVIAVENESEVEKAKEEVRKEVEEVEFTKEIEGVVLKADTLGSLEALIRLIKEEDIPIRKAEVGHVTKQDIIEAQNVKDDLDRVILAFNVKILDDAKELAEDLKIGIFQNNIIYRLMDGYKEWKYKKSEREIEDKLERVARPVKIKVLGGDFVFRVSKPAIFGVSIEKGLLKTGTLMKREDGKIVGKIKEVQSQGKIIKEAKEGERVAVSMEEVTFGRQINDGDVLVSVVSEENKQILRELENKISAGERELLEEI